MDTNDLCHLITDGIYKSCKANERKANSNCRDVIPNQQNCTSKNFSAIAPANFVIYEELLLDEIKYKVYLEKWENAQTLALNHKKDELMYTV